MERIVCGLLIIILVSQTAAAIAPPQGDSNITPSVPGTESVMVVYADQTPAPGPAVSTERVTPASHPFVLPPVALAGIIVIVLAVLGFAAHFVYSTYLNPPPPPE